jgi:beta-lactamase regulating signal transducer with metallopeptidase domain
MLSNPGAPVRIAARSGPLTAGFFRPVIVLPESLLDESRSSILSAAMAHEHARIARHDTRWAAITEIVLCFLAFHPVARLFRRRLTESREIACDAHVLAGAYPQREYANALLAMARLSIAHDPGVGLGAGSMLGRRIEELLNYRTRSRRPLCEAGIAAAVAILAIGLADTARVTLGEIHPIPALPSIQLYRMMPAPPPPPPPPRP